MQLAKLFIGGLPENVDQQWLINRFHAVSVYFPSPKSGCHPRKFAYVEVEPAQVPLLIKKFHNSKFRGNQLRVEIAKPHFMDAICKALPSSPQCAQEPTSIPNDDFSQTDKPVLKIRVGRKRARELLIQALNPRHTKFSTASSSDEQPVIKRKQSIEKRNRLSTSSTLSNTSSVTLISEESSSADQDPSSAIISNVNTLSSSAKVLTEEFNWGSNTIAPISKDSVRSRELAQTSFLLSGRQFTEHILNDDPMITAASTEEIRADSNDDASKVNASGTDSDDSRSCSSPPGDRHDRTEGTEEGLCRNPRLVAETSVKSSHEQKDDVDDDVVNEIHQSNKAMMSVLKSMFNDISSPKPAPNWNFDHRYDPANKQSISAANVIEGPESKALSQSHHVELTSDWSSLWSRPNSSEIESNLNRSTLSLSLSESSPQVSTPSEQIVPLQSSKPGLMIVARTHLRPTFLQRFAVRYQQSGECFLFRRTASVPELIRACKEAKQKRVHAYKRQIKYHRQAEPKARSRA